ncbi:MAG: FIST C-terminal domain-containing protein [Deltaproteobacteria bacterium]|jgi:hypothetical protein|nr:FIST C-terminal domain-containing protein [Deltaproteobacteria bacterium]
MIKVLTSSTDDLENPERAVLDVLGDIEEQGGLEGESVGVVACPYDFLSSGFSAYLAEKLGIPLLGISSTVSSTDKKISAYQFSLWILCSDTLVMRAGVTEPLIPRARDFSRAEIRRHMDECFLNLRESLSEGFDGPPALTIPFMPVMRGYSDGRLSRLLFAEHGEPFFGAFATDTFQTWRKPTPYVVYNGDYYDDRAAFLTIRGDAAPRFFSGELAKTNLQRRNAVITKSDGNLLLEVNDMPLFEYLSFWGLSDEKPNLVSINTNPIVVYDSRTDGYSPRAVREIRPDGSMLFNEVMPEGTIILMGKMDADEIADSASRIMGDIANMPGVRGVLAFSSASRQLNLGLDETMEARLAGEAFRGKNIPWLFAYSGGELVPAPKPRDGDLNLHLNHSVIAMAF